ncbi:MAG: secondary thiamine-phosphate synthase enzyme YjbQ [Nitrospinota bacterium]|nr:secondary thiamine-phosphate synthase enzyme YjbQ [Nitrospinota bacterium]
MKQATHEISVATRGRGLININHEIVSWVQEQGMTTGLLTVFIRHTSASLVIQENADPDVLRDLSAFFDRLVPDGDPRYRHSSEGDDDMPAHIRSALTQTQISIPLVNGRLSLGTWQDIYLFEHRTAPHRRQVVLHLSGE